MPPKEGASLPDQGCGRPFNPKLVPLPPLPGPAAGARPLAAGQPAPSRSSREDEEDEVDRRPLPRLPRAPHRVKGGRRDARGAAGPAPRAAIAPTPAPTPAPAPPPTAQAAAVSPLLTSSPGGSALPPQAQISAAHTLLGGTQEPQPRTPSPPACPPVPEPARESPSRAAVLRSNQAALPPYAPPLLYLLRSLPRSRLSPHLPP